MANRLSQQDLVDVKGEEVRFLPSTDDCFHEREMLFTMV